jgi:hypothetical protein
MYEWAAEQKDVMLVTGHTHQPVFNSLTHLEKLYRQFQLAEKDKNAQQLVTLLDEIKKREKEFTAVSADYMNMKPVYFNTGCCCYNDGDITGIEISEGGIRLVKWSMVKGNPERVELETNSLEKLVRK